MNIEELLQELATQLRGHNALIQLQVDELYIIKRIGDINRLADNPTIMSYATYKSFLDWIDRGIEKEMYHG